MAQTNIQQIKARIAKRKRSYASLTKDYKKRLKRRGITPAQYRAGASLQAARGHKPAEHVTRRQRNPTGLTSTDYRFLKNQQRRAGKDDFSNQTRAYKRLDPRRRAQLRERVTRDHREYKRQKSKSGVVRGNNKELKESFREVFTGRGGGGGGGVEDYDDEQPEPYISEEPDDYEEMDFSEYDDIYADFDEDLADLLFYH